MVTLLGTIDTIVLTKMNDTTGTDQIPAVTAKIQQNCRDSVRPASSATTAPATAPHSPQRIAPTVNSIQFDRMALTDSDSRETSIRNRLAIAHPPATMIANATRS